MHGRLKKFLKMSLGALLVLLGVCIVVFCAWAALLAYHLGTIFGANHLQYMIWDSFLAELAAFALGIAAIAFGIRLLRRRYSD